MIAVFGLKVDFEKFKTDNKESKHLFKLVGDNIEQDFCGYNVEQLIFLPDHFKRYPNLLKTYTKVLAYVRGPRSEVALAQLKQLIEVETIIGRIRRDMTSAAMAYTPAVIRK